MEGFTAVLLFESNNIRYEKVTMSYSDDRNIFKPAGSFGNMLFEDKNKWKNPLDNTPNIIKHPEIQIITYYNKGNRVVLGGTSPDSLFFTAPKYDISESRFIHPINKKLRDPLECGITDEDKSKLCVCLDIILTNINRFSQLFNQLDLTRIRVFIENYRAEVYNSANNTINRNIQFEQPAFQAPFSTLFETESIQYYGDNNGRISRNEFPGSFLIDIGDILLADSTPLVRISTVKFRAQ